MSTTYYLVIKTSLQPAQIAEMIAGVYNVNTVGDALVGESLWMRVQATESEEDDLAKGLLGSSPLITVVFRHKNAYIATDGASAAHAMAHITAAILKNIAGDCILLYNADTVSIERFGGKLRADISEFEVDDVWTDALTRAGVSFEKTKLTQPFL
jgi:hypothetical protein